MGGEVAQLAWSTAYYPLAGTPVHCAQEGQPPPRWNGLQSHTRCLWQDEIYWVDFLFLEGDLRDALVSVIDVAANRKVLDFAPAWLYAKPPAPQIRREVNEEIVVFQWPPDQPVTHRLPTFLLPATCQISVRLDNVIAQPDPISIVFLCRRPSERELDAWRGR